MPEKDPYQVLGVSRDATEEQVKAAYRELAKKYHPDNYADSPLADVANEKMQEVNAAYDAVLKDLKNRSSGGSQGYQQSYQQGYGGYTNQGGYSGGYRQQQYRQSYSGGYGGFGAYGSSFSDVRRMIQQNRLVEAEELLDGTPSTSRDGEWHFLKGTICYQRGWLDDARNHFSAACQMSPGNPEYRAALNRMSWQGQGGYGAPGSGYRQTSHPGSGMDACNCCGNLLLADCCCECMGGDLIPCC